jgi:hypothetical protein
MGLKNPICTNKGPSPLQKEYNNKNTKIARSGSFKTSQKLAEKLRFT